MNCVREVRSVFVTAVACFLVAGLAPTAAAQSEPEAPAVVVSLEQMRALEQWTRDFSAWETWAEQWFNRRQPGRWVYAVERNQKPAPPEWLAEACELVAADEPFVDGCAALTRWHQDPIAEKTRLAASATQLQGEKPEKTLWWQHVHVDGLWSSTQSNIRAFGVVGTHLTTRVSGHLQIFMAPGVLFVSVPSFTGTRELAPATDWGVSYQLFSVGRSTVHFNLVHAWILGQARLTSPSLTLAGFSVTFRPYR